MNLWQYKLLAFLHDPPSKPFQVAEHREVAQTLVRNAFPDMDPVQAASFFARVCDHTAAAADRVVCPKARAMKAEWQAEAATFNHPLGGGRLRFKNRITAQMAEEIVTKTQPHNLPYDGLPDNKRDWARFFCHWRLWPQECAKQNHELLHLPADTRIPDHTIWTHCSLVSALQTCVEMASAGDEIACRKFKPAFLLVQIGPVQEFIRRARPTRDLWSGSYLLSWLMAHGIKAVTDQIGPDCVLFPALRGQPLFDFLHKGDLYEPLGFWTDQEKLHLDEDILTPNLPNRFLAVVPEWQALQLAGSAKVAMEGELGKISKQCEAWLGSIGHPLDAHSKERWDQQVEQFLTVHWQIWPWAGDITTAITNFHQIPAGKEKADDPQISPGKSPAESLQAALDAATTGIPFDDLDPRNYKHRSWKEGNVWKSACVDKNGNDLQPRGEPIIENPGFAWAAHYAAAEFYLAARRNTRDFIPWGQWQNGKCLDLAQREGTTKDVLSGKEETIGSKEWQEALTTCPAHLFGDGDRLGAIGITKRIWHAAYLDQKRGLKRSRVAFDSVPAIAAASWRRLLIARTEHAGEARELLVEPTTGFGPLASAAKDCFSNEIADWNQSSDRNWLEQSDGSAFHLTEWDRALRDEESRPGNRPEASAKLRAARQALAKLQAQEGLSCSPGRYIAVLAMDGDSMGQWVSGARSPKFGDQLAQEALGYFKQRQANAINPAALQELLKGPRHVSPSYHLQFSEALANFSLYLAGPIVKSFDGQLIYSGGDDVLAMLPADRALDCAHALRAAFRGDPDLCTVFAGVLDTRTKDAKGDPLPSDQQPGWGFVAMDGNWEDWSWRQRRSLPRGYQVIVPGKNADISAGIAIGHMHTPLQNLVEAAREAEKAAKRGCDKGGYGKSAFAVRLYKRSGEVIRWGAKWDDGAVKLADLFGQLTDEKRVSGKFPYALAAKLRPYAEMPHPILEATLKPFRIAPVNGFDPFQVFPQEFLHALRQHSDEKWRKDSPQVAGEFTRLAVGAEAGDGYLQACRSRTLDDFLGPFLTTTFIRKGGD